MSERHEHHGGFVAVVWGVFILFLGVVLLLQALGTLPWEIWGTLWKFWPVLIILAGLSLILPRRQPWIMALVTVAALGGCLWIASAQVGPVTAGGAGHLQKRQEFLAAGIDRLDGRIDFAAGRMIIGALDAGSNLALEASDTTNWRSTAKSDTRTIDIQLRQQNGVATADISPLNQQRWQDWNVLWQLLFSRQKPLTLDARCDASSLEWDLRDLPLTDLRLQMNASSGNLVLPATGVNKVSVDMNVSNLDIKVPDGVAARILANNNVSVTSIDTARFPRQGDYYTTPGFDAATNRVTINIVCDVGRVTVK